tara:strand:- start:100 stop:1797 length:1698 start_codon:yes stop_codon:yes gene_type:complete
MAAEVTLKEESALEIGEQLAVSFKGLQNVGADTANGLELEEEKQQTSFLESISGGIKKMVVFFGGIAAATKEANRDRLITEAQGTEAEKEALADDPDRSLNIGDMFKGLGEKTKAFAGGITGIFGGLFGKAALFGLLLAFATNMDKFSGQIKEVVGPIFEGLKSAFKSIKEDIFPIITNIFGFMGEAFTAIQNILKGLFSGDGSAFLSGIKAILIDLPIRFVSIIGDAFFSLVDAVLNFFGIESQMVQDIKMAFRTLPEAVSKAVDSFVNFFTETIPGYFNSMILTISTGFNNFVNSVKTAFNNAINFVVDGVTNIISSIGNFISGIGDRIKTFINSAIDALPLPNFIKDKLKLDTKASVAADNRITETGVKAKYADDSVNAMARERAYDGGATMEEGFAEATGEKYGTAEITQTTNGMSEFAKGIMTPEQFKEYSKLDTDGQLAYLQALDSDEQARRAKILKLKEEKIAFDKKNADLIEKFKVEDEGIIGPDDQMLQDNLAYRQRTKNLNEQSAEFASAPPSVNMNMIKGGDTSTIQSNQTHTNINETTVTSDYGNAKKIFATV